MLPIYSEIITSRIKQLFPAAKTFHCTPVGGGCINECYRISFNDQQLFCKINSAAKYPQMFAREKSGLELIQKTATIKVPTVIDCFEIEEYQVLLMERISPGEKSESFWKKFGEQLAALHLVSQQQFGLHENNYMGSVPQCNNMHADWPQFFIHERLQPLVDKGLALKLLTTAHADQFQLLYKKLPSIFDVDEKPSLVHGDLWSGNFMCNKNSEPVLIDPAVYYGHRSVDMAMTTLFGGFRQPFYDAYEHHFPLPENYKEQWQVCNLYPLLIHLLLFGKSYLPQIEETISEFT